MEILLINDRSQDRTPELIEQFKEKSARIKTFHIKLGIEGLSGKANAIAQGIEHCNGELILVTDGDCRVPRNWAKAHASYYRSDVGLVGGFTLLDEKHDATSLFGKVQSLDWAFLLSVGSGAIGLGVPLSVLGNNFSFRREAYEQVGGYRNLGFTIIEDFALMKTLVKKTSWKVLYPIDPQMVVYSHPMSSLRKFYHQRKRWSAGGKEVGLYGKFLMLISYAVHFFLPVSFFIFKPIYPVCGILLLMLSDFLLLFRTTGLVARRDLLKYFPLWEIFYFGYTTFFAPVLLFPTTVNWKDITYSWKFNWKLKKMVEKQQR
jgi:cellulose synthase/poly-beta-1,6-N-acetylglucosamine synthase-like glycosyltransferase